MDNDNQRRRERKPFTPVEQYFIVAPAEAMRFVRSAVKMKQGAPLSVLDDLLRLADDQVAFERDLHERMLRICRLE